MTKMEMEVPNLICIDCEEEFNVYEPINQSFNRVILCPSCQSNRIGIKLRKSGGK